MAQELWRQRFTKQERQEAMKSREQLKEQHDFDESSRYSGLAVKVKLLIVVLIEAELEPGLIVAGRHGR